MKFKHIPVLLNECIEGLDIKPNGIYIDGTMGGAGHSSKIIEKLSNDGILIGIDRDQEALTEAHNKLKAYENVRYIYGNHDDIKDILYSMQIEKVDGILLDLGVSSYQIDEETRGFSYMRTGNLDMRMDTFQELTAKVVVNTYSEEKLADIIYTYGEEKFSRQIAKKIVEYRSNKEINTTEELVAIIDKAVPGFAKKEGHPAKRTFQAIRIEVNNEIEPLYNTIWNCIQCLKPNGRLCVITFHSLEDKAVKNAYIKAMGKCTCPKDLPYCVCNFKSYGTILNKKAITASEEEMKQNSRSRSAKLRIFERNANE